MDVSIPVEDTRIISHLARRIAQLELDLARTSARADALAEYIQANLKEEPQDAQVDQSPVPG